MAFTVIVVGDPVLASVAMGNWRNVNYGNALLPVDATGNGVNNTIAAGSSSYRFSNTYSVLGNFSGQITSSLITGTAPFSIASTTKVANLNADFLDDQTGSYYQNSDNQSAGTLPTGRLAGSYTGITAVGTLNQNTFNIAPSSGDTTFTLGQGGAYTAVYYGIGAGTSSGFQLAIYGAQNKQSGSAVDCGYIQFKHEGSSADNKCMMEFWTHNGTSVANRLTLSSNGALTGSSSDASAFDLTWRNTHATGLSRIIVQTDTSAQNAQLVSDIANTRSAVGSSSGGSNWIYFTNSNQIQMVSNGTERARLGSDFDLGANKLVFGSAIGTNTANLYASSGNLKTDDALVATGGIDAGGNGTTLKFKQISIGDWNMDTLDIFSIALGVNMQNVVFLQVFIHNDSYGVSAGGMRYDFSYQGQGGIYITGTSPSSAASVSLYRVASGFFDSASFDSTSFNRGYIQIWYSA